MSPSKPGVALVAPWRTPAEPAAPQSRSLLRRKPQGPVTYVQPSGADVFPLRRWLQATFGHPRRT